MSLFDDDDQEYGFTISNKPEDRPIDVRKIQDAPYARPVPEGDAPYARPVEQPRALQTAPPKNDWLNSLAGGVLNAPEFVLQNAQDLGNKVTGTPGYGRPQGGLLDAAEAIPDVLRGIFSHPIETMRGGLSGMVQGAATQLSPANIATSLMPEGKLALQTMKGIGGLQAIHGMKKIFENGDWAGGLGDIGFGALGYAGASIPRGLPPEAHQIIPDAKSLIKKYLEAGYKIVARHDNGTVSVAKGENPAGHQFVPPVMTPKAPSFTGANFPGMHYQPPTTIKEPTTISSKTKAKLKITDPLAISINPEWSPESLKHLKDQVKMSNIDLSKFLNADEVQTYIDDRNAKIPGTKTLADHVKEAEQDIKNKPIDVGRTREELDQYSPHGSVAKTAEAMVEKHGVDKATERAVSMIQRQKDGSVAQDYWRAVAGEIEGGSNEPSEMGMQKRTFGAPTTEKAHIELAKRIKDLEGQQNLAYRNGDTKRAVELGQEINELEGHLTRIPNIEWARRGRYNNEPSHMGLFGKKKEHTFNPDEDNTIRMEIGDREDMLRNMIGQYAEHGAKVATKELLQNAIDATVDNGGKVDVKLEYDGADSYVSVKDTGPGLTWDLIKKEYVTLTGSGKRGKGKYIGEMGVGKATYLLGAEKFSVNTVVKEADGNTWNYDFTGTPEEMITGKIKVNGKKVSSRTPTGTEVKIFDSDEGNIQKAQDYLKTFAEYSNSPVEVNLEGKRFKSPGYEHYNLDKTVTPRAVGPSKFVAEGEAPGGKYRISVPSYAGWQERNKVSAVLMNRGMFQGVDELYTNLANLPDHVIVEVDPTVIASDKKYPLTAPTRERMKDDFRYNITEEINKVLAKGAEEKRLENLKKVYNDLIPVTNDEGGINKFVIHDSGDRYTLQELRNVENSPHLQAIADVMENVLHDLDILFPREQLGKTKKFGYLIGDEGSGGINIPNPDKKGSAREYAILVNPFSGILKSSSPADFAQRFVHIIVHEFNHNKERSEGAGFTWELADTYTRYPIEDQLHAKQAILKIITGPDGNYAPEVQKLLQEYKTARGRPDTKIDLLSRQRDSEWASGTGQTGIPIRGEQDGTGVARAEQPSNKPKPINESTKDVRQPSPDLINKVAEALKAAMPVRAQQENLYSMERAKRIAKAESIVKPDAEGNPRNTGVKGFFKQKSVLAGKLPKVDYKGLKLNGKEVNTLIDNITNSPYLLGYEKIRAKDGLLKLLSKGAVPQNNELKLLREVFGAPFDQIVEMHGGFGGPMSAQVVSELVNLPKAIMASIDMSAPLRQGLPLILKDEWWNSIIPMIKSLKDPEYFKGLQDGIRDDPRYLLAKEAKLALTGMGGAKEESFVGSQYASKIPIIGKGVDASERAYTGFLNKLRFDTFNTLIKDAEAVGHHPKDIMFDIAKFVNTATGRGSLDFSNNALVKPFAQGKKGFGNLDKISNELNAVFFSPRLMASRFTILNPVYYVNPKTPWFVRKEALKSLAGIASAGLITQSLMKSMGATVNYDPTNADFMKSKFGNVRTENFGGVLPYIVAFTRLMTNQTTSSVTGKTQTLAKGFAAPTRKDVEERFLVNKFSPMASLAYNLNVGKDFEGNPLNIPKEIMDRFIPMFTNDMYDLYKEDPSLFPSGINPTMLKAIIGAQSALGAGVQVYQKPTGHVGKLRLHLR